MKLPTGLAGWVAAGAVALGIMLPTVDAAAQDLADYDYEHLSFRGVSFEGGWIFGDLVEPTYSLGARVDLGFLGPGLRVSPFVSYWSSDLERAEVAELEAQVARLITEQGGDPVDVDLGTVEWRDLVLGVDAHMVWEVPFGLRTYAGLGAAAHILNGSGPAVDDTFVEDLLDSIRAGLNAHVGVERALGPRFRLYTTGRFEALEDLQYFEVRLGGQLNVGGDGASIPGG